MQATSRLLSASLMSVLAGAMVWVGCGGQALPALPDSKLLSGTDGKPTDGTTPPAVAAPGDDGEDPPAVSSQADAGVPASTPGTPAQPAPVDPNAVPVGTKLMTTDELNVRSGPAVSFPVLAVAPVGSEVEVISTTTQNGWYNVRFGAVTGWMSGAYLKPPGTTPPPTGTTAARDEAVARAKTGVGYSYYWGHGRWSLAPPTNSNIGTCSGFCPNCTHAGVNGADCSGYVAKIWRVPSSNTDVERDTHPYSTADFNVASSQWSIISRADVKKGDAMVYRSGGSGHIYLYESGDGWGSHWAYEAKGCQYGIVHNLRTSGTGYKAIARAGY